ncbi:MAG TPA: AraC family transcriptional regulator [Polyangiaceae bacterium]|jgi:AraC-like DNA-binding protein|nr:AraC family transcriptional regulator [Polyangiaceae bacterium]
MPTLAREHFSIHFASLPRRLAHPLPLLHIGHLPKKTYWVDRVFDFVAFSVVLSGVGKLSVDNQNFEVRAPCVICEYPGPQFKYGPRRTWDEVFFNYGIECIPLLSEIGLLRKGRFLWPIRRVGAVAEMVGQLDRLAAGIETPGAPDRIERLSEWIVSETLLDNPEDGGVVPLRLLEIRRYFEEHYARSIDLRRTAEHFGFSFTTFRRHWARHMQQSPARFLNELRVKRACRMLCETALPVAEIARKLGFDDALYFSKVFRRHTRTTARDYRRRYTMVTMA